MMKDRIINILLALDCFLFSLLTLGRAYPFESFSSAAWRAERHGWPYGRVRPIIDRLFWFDPGHCRRAYEQAKLNLPVDQR